MDEETRALVEAEMKRILTSLKELEPGTKAYTVAQANYIRYATSINEDKKARADVSKICSDIDKAEMMAGIEALKLVQEKKRNESNAELESKKIDIERQRIAVDEEKNKIDRGRTRAEVFKSILEQAGKGVAIAGMIITVSELRDADMSGEYISKLALSVLPKFHL